MTFGEELSTDSQSEVGEIVDCILEAIEQRTPEYRLKQLEQQVAAWQKTSRDQLALLQECQAAIDKALGNEMQNAGALDVGSGGLLKSALEKLDDYLAE